MRADPEPLHRALNHDTRLPPEMRDFAPDDGVNFDFLETTEPC